MERVLRKLDDIEKRMVLMNNSMLDAITVNVRNFEVLDNQITERLTKVKEDILEAIKGNK